MSRSGTSHDPAASRRGSMGRGATLGAVSVVLLASFAGCTYGLTDEEKARIREEKMNKAAVEIPAWVSAAWREGVLPDGVDGGTPVQGGTMTVRISTEPGSLGYLIEPDWWLSRIILNNVNESLLIPDARSHPDYPLQPNLAVSYEDSEDHLEQTYHLRRGVTWHDGKPFTSRDVKFTFDRIMDDTVRAAHHRNAFQNLRSVETPDDYTVVFSWSEPYAWAVPKTASIPIYPAHAFEGYEGVKFNTAPFMRAPIGTGPFRFVSWEEKKAITLGRYDGYWGDKAHLDRLVFRLVSEPNVAQQLMMRGEIDLDVALTAEQFIKVAEERKLYENYHRVKYFDANYSFINWNTQRPVLRDPRVRNALTMLLDRELIIRTLLHGLPNPAHCVFYAESKACDPSVQQLGYNPQAAIDLLEQAGWTDTDGDGILDKDGLPLRFTLNVPGAGSDQMLLVYKQALFRAGIEMDIQKLEWSIFTNKLRSHEMDAGILAWIMDTDSDPYQLWHSSQTKGGSNYTAFNNPEVDRLVDEIRTKFTVEERQEVARKINEIIVRENPQTLLFNNPRRVMIHRRLRGVYVSPIQSFQFRDIWVDPDWKVGAEGEG